MALQIEQRKRDRIVGYALADLMGECLVPLTHPDQQRPSHLLATRITYPQFVEVLTACMALQVVIKPSENGFDFVDVSEVGRSDG